MGDRSASGGGSGGGQITYPTLMATNYTSWSIRVQAIIEDQCVWEIMEPSGETIRAGRDGDGGGEDEGQEGTGAVL